MNNILELRGHFEEKKGNSPGGRNIPSNANIRIDKFDSLISDLTNVLEHWHKYGSIIPGALVTARYINIVPKSNRCQSLLSTNGATANSCIVGAKFVQSQSPDSTILFQHNITYYVSLNVLNETVSKLRLVKTYLTKTFNSDTISCSDIDNINKDMINLPATMPLSKSKLVSTIVDAYYVSKFYIDTDVDDVKDNSIITIYDTKTDAVELLKKLGINIEHSNILSNNTLLLKPDELSLLKLKAPYLISMAVSDISKITRENFEQIGAKNKITIPEPTNEPVIGVIDTLFDTNVYFSKWVEYVDMVNPNVPKNSEDYHHGTAVSSIIVDGPTINPSLDDGCGRFKVKHFGVMAGKEMSSFTILQSIQEIILKNPNIKVWNFSLGSMREINLNSVSPEAAILDEIQYKNDVTFIIAGTNDHEITMKKRIGSPADSINSIVVNSVTRDGKPASYTRCGPVLSFYNKPDLCYFGGDKNELIRVCSHNGEAYVSGTSFAAPWVTRKFAYLIYKLKLSKEIAKALLIDAAAGWQENINLCQIGFGLLPRDIKEIVSTPNDEIKFFITGKVTSHEAYNFALPVPVNSDSKHPYKARATLCYFPHCNRNQGVDYTSTELSISLGKLVEKKSKIRTYTTIDSINGNVQDEAVSYIYEQTARALYRKWDNVKHVKEKLTKHAVKSHSSHMWGLRVVQKERCEEPFGQGIAWGVIVTLKDIEGKNRIDTFIQQCKGKQWIVNRIDIEQQIEIYNQAEQDIKFDE